jgi:hypothetical protein
MSISLSPSIANIDLWINDLPGVVISTIFLFMVDINILSIHAASVVAAKGLDNFLAPVTGSVTT